MTIPALPIPNVTPSAFQQTPGLGEAIQPGLQALLQAIQLEQQRRKMEEDKFAQGLAGDAIKRFVRATDVATLPGINVPGAMGPLGPDTRTLPIPGVPGPLAAALEGMPGQAVFQATQITQPILASYFSNKFREKPLPEKQLQLIVDSEGFWRVADKGSAYGQRLKDPIDGHEIKAEVAGPGSMASHRFIGIFVKDGRDFAGIMSPQGQITMTPVGEGFTKEGNLDVESEKAAGRYREVSAAWEQLKGLPPLSRGAVNFVLSLAKLGTSEKAQPIMRYIAESSLSEPDKQLLIAYSTILAKRVYKDSGAAVTIREWLGGLNYIPLATDRDAKTLQNKRQIIQAGIMDDYVRGLRALRQGVPAGVDFTPVNSLFQDEENPDVSVENPYR